MEKIYPILTIVLSLYAIGIYRLARLNAAMIWESAGDEYVPVWGWLLGFLGPLIPGRDFVWGWVWPGQTQSVINHVHNEYSFYLKILDKDEEFKRFSYPGAQQWFQRLGAYEFKHMFHVLELREQV